MQGLRSQLWGQIHFKKERKAMNYIGFIPTYSTFHLRDPHTAFAISLRPRPQKVCFSKA